MSIMTVVVVMMISHCAMEISAYVDTSISTLPEDPITNEKTPTVSSKGGDDNDENIYLGNKWM